MSLLGGILKGVGGFLTGGPAGAIAGVASELLKPKATAATPSVPTITRAASVLPVLRPAVNVATAFPQLPDSTRSSGVVLPGGAVIGTRTTYGPGNQTQSGWPGVQSGSSSTAPSPCMAGYHWNKTGYYTKSGGWIAPRSKWVRNRRRNPLNPRALSKALSRLTSAKRAVTVLDRIEVKGRRRRR